MTEREDRKIIEKHIKGHVNRELEKKMHHTRDRERKRDTYYRQRGCSNKKEVKDVSF